MFVKFVSSSQATGNGFEIVVSFEKKSMSQDILAKTPGCQGTPAKISSSKNYLSSPGYDVLDTYPEDANCLWEIEAPENYVSKSKNCFLLLQT